MRPPHETVATVLVAPSMLREIELALAAHDLWTWPVASAPICVDGERTAFQVRHRMIEARRGEWDLAADWLPVWIAFGESWRRGDEPLSWTAHSTLWRTLEAYADHVRYRRRLGGVAPLVVRREATA